MKTFLITLGSAFLLAGCGGGGSASSAPGPSDADASGRSSHWEVPALSFGMTTTRVKTRRSVLLYNDGSKAVDFTLLYNLPPELEGEGCAHVQPGAACEVVFWWKPTQDSVMSSSVYPTREQARGTELAVQGAAIYVPGGAMAPFWTASGMVQWEGEVNFTLPSGHTVTATRIAWSSQCEAVFKGSVAADLDGKVLQVSNLKFPLLKGQELTLNGEAYTRYQSKGDGPACDLPQLVASSGNYNLNI